MFVDTEGEDTPNFREANLFGIIEATTLVTEAPTWILSLLYF